MMHNPSPPHVPAPRPTELDHWLPLLAALLILLTLIYPFIRTTGFLDQKISSSTSLVEGSSLFRLVYSSTFFLAGLLCWRYGRWTLQIWLRSNLFLFALALWALLSVFWSPLPEVTLKRAIQFFGLILVGTSLVLPQLRSNHLIRTLCTSLTVLLFICFLAVLLIPHIAIDAELDNGWRGILWHKNLLGMAASFTTLMWLYRALARDTSVRIALLGGSFTLMMLLMSRSLTSLISCLFGCLVYLFLRRHYIGGAQQRLQGFLYFFIALLASGLVFFTVFGHLPSPRDLLTPLFILFGKSPDMTGRTDIWQLVLLQIYQNPIQGIGYGAFWLGAGSPSQYIIDILGWVPLHAHQGYIDILNELGLIGLGLFLGLLIWHTIILIQLMRIDREQAALHGAFFLMFLVSNFSETQFLQGVNFQNCFFIFSVLLVSSLLVRHRAVEHPRS